MMFRRAFADPVPALRLPAGAETAARAWPQDIGTGLRLPARRGL